MNHNSAEKFHIATVNELFGQKDDKPKSSQENKDGVQEIAISELHSFKDHPFQVRNDEEMEKLVDSIKENGVLSPGIVRKNPEGGYELIAGHRRHRACELAGLDTMPVIVEDLSDDQSTIVMVDSNLQRENIFPSERAFAYKMKLEAMKRQGKRTDLTSSQLGTKLTNKRADELLAEETGESRNQVQRFIRLTELDSKLLKMVDEKKLSFNPAVEISYLTKDEQSILLDVMEAEDSAPSISQAQRLKKFSQEGNLTVEATKAIMTEEKDTSAKITIKGSKLTKYFPPNYTPAQMENVIFELLDGWKKRHG